MFSCGNLQSLGINAPDSVKHNHMLLDPSMQGSCQGQLIIDPCKKSGIFELVLHRQIKIRKRHYDFR